MGLHTIYRTGLAAKEIQIIHPQNDTDLGGEIRAQDWHQGTVLEP